MTEDYKKLESQVSEIFVLLNPPNLKVTAIEPSFFWQDYLVNWDSFVAEHSALLDYRIELVDKIRIYNKIVVLLKHNYKGDKNVFC